MKTLCVYGSGGMGREIVDLAQTLLLWDNIVFVDDRKNDNYKIDGFDVLNFKEIKSLYNNSSAEFCIAVGEPYIRERLSLKVINSQYNLTNIFYPGFKLSNSSTISNGTTIHLGAILTINVHIGQSCFINKGVIIGHDVNIGDYSVISPNVSIGGNVNIGRNCFLGSGAVIRNGVSIGDGSIIGIGAVVLADVADYSVMVGNPAKLLKQNIDKKVFN